MYSKEKNLQKQIDTTASAVIENSLSLQNSNTIRRTEDYQERMTRYDEDGDLQGQINALAETCIQIMLNDSDTRKKISEVSETISGSTGVASNNEVDEMLDEVYNS